MIVPGYGAISDELAAVLCAVVWPCDKHCPPYTGAISPVGSRLVRMPQSMSCHSDSNSGLLPYNNMPCYTLHVQGHTMDAPSASAALEALQAESAWALSGPLLAACMEADAVVSPLLLQHILLVATQDKAWRIAKEVLQVCLTLVLSQLLVYQGSWSVPASSVCVLGV